MSDEAELTVAEEQALRKKHRTGDVLLSYHNEAGALVTAVDLDARCVVDKQLWPCPTVRALDALALAHADRDAYRYAADALARTGLDSDGRRRRAVRWAWRFRQMARAGNEVQWDGTDFAHPAWLRGHDDGVRGATDVIRHAQDGQDDGSGVIGYEPLEQARRLVLKSRGTVGRLLVAKARAEVAAAELEVLRRLASAMADWRASVVNASAVATAGGTGWDVAMGAALHARDNAEVDMLAALAEWQRGAPCR